MVMLSERLCLCPTPGCAGSAFACERCKHRAALKYCLEGLSEKSPEREAGLAPCAGLNCSCGQHTARFCALRRKNVTAG